MNERVFHHYRKWEDYKFGMYEKTCFMDETKMIVDCEIILRCPEWLWESMTFVSHQWQYSAEQNLLNLNRNRQAWLGQAACCFTHGAPEYLTKKAWNNLNQKQQEIANSVADDVLNDWENKYKMKYFSWQK